MSANMTLNDHYIRLKTLTKAMQKSQAEKHETDQKLQADQQRAEENARALREKQEKERLEKLEREDEVLLKNAMEKFKAELRAMDQTIAQEWTAIQTLNALEASEATRYQQQAPAALQTSSSKALIWSKVNSAVVTVSAAAYDFANYASATAASAGTAIQSGIYSGIAIANQYLKG